MTRRRSASRRGTAIARPAHRARSRRVGRSRPGAEADRRRLRLLDLPAQRHHHVLLLLRGLCGAERQHRRRPERRASCSIMRTVAIETGVPAALELHLRHGRHRGANARNSRSGSTVAMAVTCRARRSPSSRSSCTSSPIMIARGAGPGRSALPVGLLRARRLPRPARHRRPALAADHDGAGLRQGLPRRHPAPHPLLHLFWHALDIIWVGVFSLVYLLGVAL